jgi:hypothetical protein
MVWNNILYSGTDGADMSVSRERLNTYENAVNGRLLQINAIWANRNTINNQFYYGAQDTRRWFDIFDFAACTSGNNLNFMSTDNRNAQITTVFGMRIEPLARATYDSVLMRPFGKSIPQARDADGNLLDFPAARLNMVFNAGNLGGVNANITAAQRNGMYQNFQPEPGKYPYRDTLEIYMKYFSIDMYANGVSLQLLPGVTPEGRYLYGAEYDAGWVREFKTMVPPHLDPEGRFKMKVEWNPVEMDPYQFKIYDRRGGYLVVSGGLGRAYDGNNGGNQGMFFGFGTNIPALVPFNRPNGAAYTIERQPNDPLFPPKGTYSNIEGQQPPPFSYEGGSWQIFDYRDIFVEEYPVVEGGGAGYNPDILRD